MLLCEDKLQEMALVGNADSLHCRRRRHTLRSVVCHFDFLTLKTDQPPTIAVLGIVLHGILRREYHIDMVFLGVTTPRWNGNINRNMSSGISHSAIWSSNCRLWEIPLSRCIRAMMLYLLHSVLGGHGIDREQIFRFTAAWQILLCLSDEDVSRIETSNLLDMKHLSLDAWSNVVKLKAWKGFPFFFITRSGSNILHWNVTWLRIYKVLKKVRFFFCKALAKVFVERVHSKCFEIRTDGLFDISIRDLH